MKLLSVILIYTFTLNALAQTNEISYYPLPEWENIRLTTEAIADSLDKILIVTNRPYTPEDKKGIWFPNKISKFRKLSYLEVACQGQEWLIKIHDNFESATQALEKDKDLLLFVHGHGKSLPPSIERAMRVKKRYDVALILFDWPAKNSNFNKSLSRVRRCSKNFHNLLLNLKDYRAQHMNQEQSLNLLAHSLGNYFLTHLAVNGAWQHLQEPFIDNIIFNAPAVRSKEHGEAISLLKFSKHKYVFLNKNDFILKGARFLTFGRMLGNEVIQPYAQQTKYVHFTEIAGSEHTYFVGYHDFEHNNPAVFPLYNNLIHGQVAQFKQLKLEAINEKEYTIKPTP